MESQLNLSLHLLQKTSKFTRSLVSTPPNSSFTNFSAFSKMFDDQDLGFFANFLGIFIFILVIAYHFVIADPKFE